jgi:hypothetical protein
MKARKVSYQRNLQELVSDYMREKKVDIVDLDDVARWAIVRGRWHERPVDPFKRCKQELARALAAQTMVDPQGREVRSMIAVPVGVTEGGQLQWEWAPMFIAKAEHFRLSQQVRRKAILADCKAHKMDSDSYNDNNVHGSHVGLFDYNFNPDLEEDELPDEYPDENPDQQ